MRARAEDDRADTDPTLDIVLGLVKEVGEVARALAGVAQRVERESEATGLVDIIMFEQERDAPARVVVASLDREYVDDKLLWRMDRASSGCSGRSYGRRPTAQPSTRFATLLLVPTVEVVPVAIYA
jgi:hypothetical protein